MSQRNNLSRYQFLRLAGLGTGALVLAACGRSLFAQPMLSATATADTLSDGGEVMIDLTAAPGTANLLPGVATRVWKYQGQVGQGAASNLQIIPDSYLGPILRLQRGQNLKLRFTNRLPDTSIVHWHGLSVPETMDGHPRYAISQGKSYDYEYRCPQ